MPLARIKKIMKSEEAVFQELERERLQQQAAILGGVPGTTSTRFMIASEAPVLLGKACEIMVRELTVRAWRHTERNRRRTLQRQDVYAAVGESEMFDFLIDLVPRITPATQQWPMAFHAAPPPPTDPTPVVAAPANGQSTDASMSLSDAERRYADLQHMQEQMQEQYMIMQQRMQPDGSAPAQPPHAQPQVMMNPHFMILPPQGDGLVPQWQAPAPTGAGTNTMPPPGI